MTNDERRAVLRRRLLQTAARGTSEHPMTREEVIGKARALVAPVIGAATCQRLIDRVFALDGARDVRALRPVLQRA